MHIRIIFISILIIQTCSSICYSQKVRWLDDNDYKITTRSSSSKLADALLQDKASKKVYGFANGELVEKPNISNFFSHFEYRVLETGTNEVTIAPVDHSFADQIVLNIDYDVIKNGKHDLDTINRIFYFRRNDSTFCISPGDEKERFIIDKGYISFCDTDVLSFHEYGDGLSHTTLYYSLKKRKMLKVPKGEGIARAATNHFVITALYPQETYGLVDHKGRTIVSQDEGFTSYEKKGKYIVLMKKGKVKAFCKTKEIKVDPDLVEIYPRCPGLWIGDLKNGKIKVLKSPDKLLIDEEFDDDTYRSDFVQLKKGNKWLIINKDIKKVAFLEADDVYTMNENLFEVTVGFKKMVVDKNNNTLIDNLGLSDKILLSQFFNRKFIHVIKPEEGYDFVNTLGQNSLYELSGKKIIDWHWKKTDSVIGWFFVLPREMLQRLGPDKLEELGLFDIWVQWDQERKNARLESASGTLYTEWLDHLWPTEFPDIFIGIKNGRRGILIFDPEG